MGLLMLIYAICSLRTNACFFLIFVALIFFFTLLAGSWWQLAQEHAVIGEKLQVVSLSIFVVVTLSNNPTGKWRLSIRGCNDWLLPLSCATI